MISKESLYAFLLLLLTLPLASLVSRCEFRFHFVYSLIGYAMCVDTVSWHTRRADACNGGRDADGSNTDGTRPRS